MAFRSEWCNVYDDSNFDEGLYVKDLMDVECPVKMGPTVKSKALSQHPLPMKIEGPVNPMLASTLHQHPHLLPMDV